MVERHVTSLRQQFEPSLTIGVLATHQHQAVSELAIRKREVVAEMLGDFEGFGGVLQRNVIWQECPIQHRDVLELDHAAT